jgi:hypothetical protein
MCRAAPTGEAVRLLDASMELSRSVHGRTRDRPLLPWQRVKKKVVDQAAAMIRAATHSQATCQDWSSA